MRMLKNSLLMAAAVAVLISLPALASAGLVFTGFYDGPLTGGTPKGVELVALTDIADLSIYGIGSANNGGGTDGQEYTFPAESASQGDVIYVATDEEMFTAWFGFPPTYVDTGYGVSINGDDAMELFCDGLVIDTFGELDVDGNGEPWEYMDGWAYRVSYTGPDGVVFVLESWTFSGANAWDGELTNDTALVPMPIGTFETIVDGVVGSESKTLGSVKALYGR